MLYNDPGTCWCGCQTPLILEIEGSLAPKNWEALHLRCPVSGEDLGYSSRGHWLGTNPAVGHTLVRVSRVSQP